MAGNPFRRSMAVAPPAETARETLPMTADAPSTPPKKTKTKRVKIESPPHAIIEDTIQNAYSYREESLHENAIENGNGGRRLSASDSATRAPSPPPPPPTTTDNNGNDDDDIATSHYLATDGSDSDQAALNARSNSGSLAPPTAAGMKAPYNPFARTLATSEASFGLQQDAAPPEAQRQKPAMDVDAFKNILLTGSAIPQNSNSNASDVGGPSSSRSMPPGSSSKTDTSSIYGPTYTLHPESPRVDSYDFHSDSDSDDDDNDEEAQHETEKSNLMGQGRSDDLAPPAPPKPKSTRGPQTVSFADFDQSIPPNFQAPGGRGTPPLNTQQKGILRPTAQRSISDLNKPLPLPPANREPSDTTPPPVVPEKDSTHSQQPPTLATTPSDDMSTPKKVPPPPPVSRRQAATPARPRSASNLSAQESISDLPDPDVPSNTPPQGKTDDTASSKLSVPPPPPPSRKVHPVAPSSSTAHSPSPSHAPTEAKPLVPPPPPRRHPSKSGSARTASPANSLRKDVPSPPTSGHPPGSNAAPPPPPPRRAAGGTSSSQRSSIDGRPSSLRKFNGVENQRRASRQSVESAGSEQAVSSPSTEAAKRDVLADMTAFQAELDALRLQAEGGR